MTRDRLTEPEPSEITPEKVYLSRRQFVARAAAAAGAVLLAGCGSPGQTGQGLTRSPRTGATADEAGNTLTPLGDITSYNNFYEFSFGKEDVGAAARDFKTRPWTVQVGGLVHRPHTYDIDDMLRRFHSEERIYRMRCVEGWSMVIPWLGFPLSKLIAEAQPMSKARYVRFTTLYNPKQMPGQKNTQFKWPYVEGLRLDEALHPLTLLSNGLYGKALKPQNGAPLRLVVPWKYGFKSIKSIVKIDLVEKMPVSLWMLAGPDEYGFYANVNPAVPHPRWTQSSERRIGELRRRATLPFNGYGQQVAGLYKGMDLKKFY